MKQVLHLTLKAGDIPHALIAANDQIVQLDACPMRLGSGEASEQHPISYDDLYNLILASERVIVW